MFFISIYFILGFMPECFHVKHTLIQNSVVDRQPIGCQEYFIGTAVMMMRRTCQIIFGSFHRVHHQVTHACLSIYEIFVLKILSHTPSNDHASHIYVFCFSHIDYCSCGMIKEYSLLVTRGQANKIFALKI